MIWTVLAVLVVLWFLGFNGNVGGDFIHLLLVAVFVLLIIKLEFRRRSA